MAAIVIELNYLLHASKALIHNFLCGYHIPFVTEGERGLAPKPGATKLSSSQALCITSPVS
jgi:hypothetical protein